MNSMIQELWHGNIHFYGRTCITFGASKESVLQKQ